MFRSTELAACAVQGIMPNTAFERDAYRRPSILR
jgi:hypothetical protein